MVLQPLRNPHPLIGVVALSISCAAVLAGGKSLAGLEPSVSELISSLLAAALGAVALGLLWRSPVTVSLRTVFLLALVLRVLAAQGWPLLEDDYFRYLWDGRQTLLTLSPWQHAPAEFFGDDSLSPQWQTILDGINNPDLPTIYGPLWQLLFALSYLLAPGELWAFQSLLILIDMAVLCLLARQGLSSRWLLAYAIHPLVLRETIVSAHPDIVLALLLLVALYAWRRGAGLVCGLSLGAAVAGKVSALVVMPFFLFSIAAVSRAEIPRCSRRILLYPLFLWGLLQPGLGWLLRLLVGFVLALGLLYLPVIFSQGSEWASLQTFAQQWRFNPLLFRVCEWLLSSPWDRLIAAAAAFSVVMSLWWIWLRDAARGGNTSRPPLDLALTVLLLFSPVVNNWYWCWVLPLAVALQRGWLVAACLAGTLAYINGATLFATDLPIGMDLDWFEVPLSLAVLQIILIFLSWVVLKWVVLKRNAASHPKTAKVARVSDGESVVRVT